MVWKSVLKILRTLRHGFVAQDGFPSGTPSDSKKIRSFANHIAIERRTLEHGRITCWTAIPPRDARAYKFFANTDLATMDYVACRARLLEGGPCRGLRGSLLNVAAWIRQHAQAASSAWSMQIWWQCWEEGRAQQVSLGRTNPDSRMVWGYSPRSTSGCLNEEQPTVSHDSQSMCC